MTTLEPDFPLWDDNPSDVDLLGFASLVAPARQALTRPSLDPVCVGVFGPWGSGKTSVAKHVHKELDAQDGVLVIYAEPWAFDPATDPKARLIGIVLNAINAHLKGTGSLTSDLRDAIGKLAKRIRWSRAVKLTAKTALTAQLPSIDELADVFKGDEDAPVDEPSIDGFRDDFAQLMTDPALRDVQRLVVIVDDLDRCLPDTVVDVLEAIKLFLAVPKMAFLIAADEKAVRFAIATRYATTRVAMEKEAMELAVRYLDKIVHIPIRLPVLSLMDVEAYVLQLLLLQDPNGVAHRDAVRDHCDQRRRGGESSLLQGLPSAVDQEHLILAERLAPVLYEGMDGNPRRIKRFLNELWLRSVFAQARGVDVDHSAVAKLMVLEQVHESAFEEMLEWVRAGTIEDKLTALQEGKGDTSVQLRRWAEMEPRPLDPAAVRKYLVLAASLRGSTIPTEALPAHLREIAGRLVSSSDQVRRRATREAKELSVEDRSLVGVHVAEAVRAQPSRQPDLAEVLADLAASDIAVEASIVDALRKMRAADVDVPLVVNLAPPGGSRSKAVADLLSYWEADPDLPAATKRAVAQTLEGGSH
jgi:RecA/RadA recombinase